MQYNKNETSSSENIGLKTLLQAQFGAKLYQHIQIYTGIVNPSPDKVS